jgi:hypothetical protein
MPLVFLHEWRLHVLAGVVLMAFPLLESSDCMSMKLRLSAVLEFPQLGGPERFVSGGWAMGARERHAGLLRIGSGSQLVGQSTGSGHDAVAGLDRRCNGDVRGDQEEACQEAEEVTHVGKFYGASAARCCGWCGFVGVLQAVDEVALRFPDVRNSSVSQ